MPGPQGIFFGKNTTAGAFNISTRRPRFQHDPTVESSFCNYGFIQTKGSVTGPLSMTLAARLSFSGMTRDGLVYNEATQKNTNTLNNLGLRGQLLFVPSSKLGILLAADAIRQRPDGYAQVVAGVVQTKRAAFRLFDQIIKEFNYRLPTTNPFDRVTDHDMPWRSNNDIGVVSLNIDAEVGGGTLTLPQLGGIGIGVRPLAVTSPASKPWLCRKQRPDMASGHRRFGTPVVSIQSLLG